MNTAQILSMILGFGILIIVIVGSFLVRYRR